MTLRFSKMHGIGNDFVIVDCRTQPFTLEAAQIARLGDRHFGVGFDQLLTIEPGDSLCAFRYGIYNADGSRALQCGNGVRCVAAWLQRAGALNKGAVRLQSPSGPVSVELLDDGRVRVDMGVPRFAPEEIPLRMPASDIYWLQINDLDVEFGAVSMGNPHAVIEIADVANAPLETLGRALSMDFHKAATSGLRRLSIVRMCACASGNAEPARPWPAAAAPARRLRFCASVANSTPMLPCNCPAACWTSTGMAPMRPCG
jgi:diaminopimelate epimerase